MGLKNVVLQRRAPQPGGSYPRGTVTGKRLSRIGGLLIFVGAGGFVLHGGGGRLGSGQLSGRPRRRAGALRAARRLRPDGRTGRAARPGRVRAERGVVDVFRPVSEPLRRARAAVADRAGAAARRPPPWRSSWPSPSGCSPGSWEPCSSRSRSRGGRCERGGSGTCFPPRRFGSW